VVTFVGYMQYVHNAVNWANGLSII
jgi:hypothetical protein